MFYYEDIVEDLIDDVDIYHRSRFFHHDYIPSHMHYSIILFNLDPEYSRKYVGVTLEFCMEDHATTYKVKRQYKSVSHY